MSGLIKTIIKGVELNRLSFKIPQAGVCLVFCMRNELFRLPFFLDYYRELGISGFLIVDNNSDDGGREYLLEQPDCSVWHTTGSYLNSNFGMEWCNFLINRYLNNRWVMCCDPDEFLVYPSCEDRNIPELTEHMDKLGQCSLFSVMIDAYGEYSIDKTRLSPGQNPFVVAPYFDLTTPSQKYDHQTGKIWVQGGVRQRIGFNNNPRNSPAINKVPIIKWRIGYRYLSSMHHTNKDFLNYNLQGNENFVSGALFHFKFVSSLAEKAKEELVRKQHYNNSSEYKSYLENINRTYYSDSISCRYKDSYELERLGFIQRGVWY